MKYFIIFVTILYRALAQIFIISPINTAINAATTYQIFITQRTNPLDLGGSIRFDFPSNVYTTSQLSGATCSPISCTVSSYSITIPTATITNYTEINLNISNIVNPPSIISSNSYSYYILTIGGTIAQTSNTSITFIAGTLGSCKVTFSPNSVRKYGVATVSITPGNPIVTNGSVSITFPTIWNNIPANFSQNTVNTSSLSCTANGATITNTVVACSYSSGSIAINNIFNASTSQTFTISISSVLSLPISLSNTQVSVGTLDSLGNQIDNPTSCNVMAPNPNTFSVSSSLSTIYPSTNISPIFSLISTDVVAVADTIIITTDGSTINFVNSSRLTFTISDGISTSSNSFITASSSLSNSTSAAFVITSAMGPTKSTNAAITLSGISYLAPPNTKSSTPINISFYRAGGIYMTGQIAITPTVAALTSLSLTANNYLVNAQTYYTVVFTTTSPLSSTAQIVIRIPSTVITTSYSNQTCYNILGTNVSSSPQCAMSNNVLTVTNIFTNSFKGGNSLNISFSGVSNPLSTAPTSAFNIYTFYDSSGTTYPVDQDLSTLTLTATPDTINLLSITPSSYVVGASSNYTINYTLKNQLPTNSYIIIGMPANISFVNPSNINANLAINGAPANTLIPTYISTSTSNYSTALNFTGISGTVLPSGTVLVFTFGTIINPYSTASTGSFSVLTYQKPQYLIQSQISGITTAMTTPVAFSSLSVKPNTTMNGDTGFYLFTLTPSINLPQNSILIITIPAQIKLEAPFACNDLTTISPLAYSYSSNILNITLSQPGLNTSTIYQIQISTFVNPRTFTQSSSFTLTTYNNQNYLVNYQSLAGIINTLPNYIVSLSSAVTNPSQSYLNSNQQIQFNLVTKNYLISTDYLELFYPPGYTYNTSYTGSVCSQSTYTCTPETQANNLTIKITGNFINQYTFTFTINGYISPNLTTYASSSFPFKVNTYQSNGNLIDIINTSNTNSLTYFTLSCNPLCQTCSTLDSSSCLSCYNSLITTYIYLYNNTCVSSCAAQLYPGTSTCLPCVSPCLTCSNAISCLSCVDSTLSSYYFYFSGNQSCLNVCPSGYYGSSTFNYNCMICSSNCLTCSNTNSNCTSCNSNYYLNGSVCLATCPSGYYNISFVCQACDISCYSCNNTAVSCLICANNYVVVGSICTNTCASGTVPYNGICSCSSLCLTCNGVYDNCTLCKSGSSYPYFYLNSCVSSCPVGTYVNSTNCSTCPTGCSSCYSNLTCPTCISNFYYYNGNCLSSCPTGTYISATACLTCSINCSACAISSTNCSSCVSGFSLDGNNCVQNCSQGLSMPSASGSICTPCTNNCSTCSVNLDNCTSCTSSSGTSLSGSSCVATCPLSTISLSNICTSCQNPCLTCNISLTNCLSCLSTYYTINQSGIIKCVTNCTSSALFSNGTQCIPCQSPCSICVNTSTTCSSCISGYYLLNSNCYSNCSGGYLAYQGNCIVSCPTNYIPSNGTCQYNNQTTNSTNNGTTNGTTNCTTSNCTNSTITTLTNSMQSKIVPFPFFICYAIIGALSIISKLSAKQTFIPAMILTFNSLIEVASWVVVAFLLVQLNYVSLFSQKRLLFSIETNPANIGLCFMLLSAMIHYILNLVNLIFYCKYIKNDSSYIKWLKSSINSTIEKVSLIVSLFISHKSMNLPFSKTFGISYFKAPLANNLNYYPINIIVFLSFIVSLGFITGFALIAYDPQVITMSQLYVFAIDALVVTICNLVCGIWSLRKQQNFFDEDQIKKYEAKDQIHNNNETVQELNGNHEFEQQLSVEEAVVAQLGKKPNYSKIAKFNKQNNSQISRQSKNSQFIKFDKTNSNNKNGININESEKEIDIHEASSQYVSEEGEKNIFNIKNEKQINSDNQIKFSKRSQSHKQQNIIYNYQPSRGEQQFETQKQDGLNTIKLENKQQRYIRSHRSTQKQLKKQNKKSRSPSQKQKQKNSTAYGKFKSPLNKQKSNISNGKSDSLDKNIQNISLSKQKDKKNEKSQSLDKSKKSSSIEKKKSIISKSKEKDQILNKTKIKKTKQGEVSDYNRDQDLQQEKIDQIPYYKTLDSIHKKQQIDSAKQDQQFEENQRYQEDLPKSILDRKKSQMSADGNLLKGKRENEILRSMKQKMKQKGLKINNKQEQKRQLDTIDLGEGGLTRQKSTKSHKITQQEIKRFEKQKQQNNKNFGLNLSPNNLSMVKTMDQPQQLPNKPKVLIKEYDRSVDQSQHSNNDTKIDSDFIKKIYNDDESLRSAEDALIQFNQISPSQFNIQNQRFDDLGFKHNMSEQNRNSFSTNQLFKKSDKISQIYQQQSSIQDDNEFISRGNVPKLLQPQKKHVVPNHASLLSRPPEERYKTLANQNLGRQRQQIHYQSIDRTESGTIGYDGIYERIQGRPQNDITNTRKMKGLQKIYLQRLDVNNKKRKY